jgi:hypothetical protein
MKIQASFVRDRKWWVTWTDDVPGALTQGASLEEARENLIDAVRLMRQPTDLSKLPKNKICDRTTRGVGERRKLIRHLERLDVRSLRRDQT